MPLPIGFQGIEDSWRKTKSAFVATQTNQQEGRSSHCKHYERPEMMIVSLSAQ
jgi:hypothetical protein